MIDWYAKISLAVAVTRPVELKCYQKDTPVLVLSEAAIRTCSRKKLFLNTSQNSPEKSCVEVSFFNKIVVMRPANLFKKRLQSRCFPVDFAKSSIAFFHRVPPAAPSMFSRKNFQNSFLEFVGTTAFSHLTIFSENSILDVWLGSDRGSCPEVFCKKGVPEIFQNSQENNCARVFFLN